VPSLTGQLLIASPGLLDPNFRRTVVLITEHNEEGAAGLVLNRPSLVEVAAAVPQLEELVEEDEQVWVGGPVEPAAVVVLAEFDDDAEPAVPILDGIGFAALDEGAEAIAAVTRRRRVFAGYAGWGGGQLEAELERDDWILEPARPDDVFAEDADGLWRAVLRRKGGIFELVARMPDDPSMN
jgi:putative transcriptional regulator